jgi:hypothetical protein
LQPGVACPEILIVQGVGLQFDGCPAANQIAAQLDFVQQGIGLLEIEFQLIDIFL